jgi:hypothetical protein
MPADCIPSMASAQFFKLHGELTAHSDYGPAEYNPWLPNRSPIEECYQSYMRTGYSKHLSPGTLGSFNTNIGHGLIQLNPLEADESE